MKTKVSQKLLRTKYIHDNSQEMISYVCIKCLYVHVLSQNVK
jgi:hypothetical protein